MIMKIYKYFRPLIKILKFDFHLINVAAAVLLLLLKYPVSEETDTNTSVGDKLRLVKKTFEGLE